MSGNGVQKQRHRVDRLTRNFTAVPASAALFVAYQEAQPTFEPRSCDADAPQLCAIALEFFAVPERLAWNPLHSCHPLVETSGKRDPAPIRFAASCERCHRLPFDPARPDAEVPHGDPALVYDYLLAAFSGNATAAAAKADEVMNGQCASCHEVRRTSGGAVVTPPRKPARWFRGVSFSHGSHTEVACESCHAAARRSSRAADVLLPSRNACVECHGPRTVTASGGASNACVLCHVYHDHLTSLVPIRAKK